ncbi:MAG TPA: asparaginase [Sandaracinaceae bacterium LLY-WYZ-13_1]|nr:asparaginase [Sandaracinaceae bacterium LLY-WYZ-13_1]
MADAGEKESNVLVLYTGGTIGMRAGPRGYEPVPGYFADLVASFPTLHDDGRPRFVTKPSRSGRRIRYDLVAYDPPLDSANLALRDWARFARDIGDAYDDYDAFVVVHGTDTMAYTASALSFMLEGLTKPVILTGAQIPLEQLRNDALDNLLGALGVAGHYRIPEVGLYFHHRLLRGCRATKVDAAGLDAFASPNLPALVEVGIDVRVAWNVVRSAPMGGLRVHADLSPHVAALRLYPGMTRAILENFLRPPLEGLVLETFGSGNAPDRDDDLLGALRDATDRGVTVVNVTQCQKGRVGASYAAGRALIDAGVVPGADMTAEAALAKLAFLLGQDLSTEQIRERLGVSLRGELTEEYL